MAVKKISSLNQHENPETNENEVDIENYLNENWDTIIDVVDNNADELIIAQDDIENLQTDNTKNKKNIQTNTDDISTLKKQKEALEKEVNSLREDNRLNALTEDNSGELINITNSTGSRFNSLKIEGNEKQFSQDSTSNLLVLENGNKTIDGVDFSIQNGMVNISGTATASIHTICGKAYLHEGETYYIDKYGTSSNLRI